MFVTGRVMEQLDTDKLKDTIEQTEKVYVIVIKKITITRIRTLYQKTYLINTN